MKRKHLLMTLLLALFVPIAMNAQLSLPYSEDFQSTSLNNLPSGWTIDQTVGTGTVVVQKETMGDLNKVLAFAITALNGNSGGVSVRMPLNRSDVSYMKMGFRLKPTSTMAGTFQIGYTNNTFTTLATYEASSGVSWRTITDLPITLPDRNRLLLSMITQTASTGWIVDDIVITDGYRPTNIASSNIGDDAATITWDDNDAAKWQIQYKLSSESNWTAVGGTLSSTSYTFSDLLAGTSYDVQVRAKAPSGSFYSGWSETCTFTTTGCAVPTNVHVYANPVEGVTVSWEGNASSYNIQYENIETFQSGYHNGLVTTTSNTYTFNGTESVPVLPGMRHILRVQAQCNPSTASEWSDWVEFTDCLTYMDLPMHANFDYIPTNWSSLPHADLPGCWTRINGSTDPTYSSYPLVESNQSLCHSGYYSQGFYNYIRFKVANRSNTQAMDQYLVFPPIDAVSAGDVVTLSFYIRSAEGVGTCEIGLMEQYGGIENFQGVYSIGNNSMPSTYEAEKRSFTFTYAQLSAKPCIAIKVPVITGTDIENSICIDDIDIYPAGYHCDEPVNLHTENIGATSARIVWENPQTGGGEYGLKYKKASDGEWTIVSETGIVSQNFSLGDLDANTLYNVAVRNNCNDVDHSEWVEATFTTLDVMPVPTNLHVLNTGSSWVDLAWDCTPAAGQIEVDRYGLEISDDGVTWYGPQENAYWGTFAAQCIIDPISPGTHYVRVRVINVIGNEVQEGNCSEPLQFTIEGCNTVVTIRPEDPSETYDFNSSTLLPECWTVYGTTPYGISIKNGALDFEIRRNVEAKYVELEEFLVMENYCGLVVSFDWYHVSPVANNTTNVTVQLQYCLGQNNENWQNAGDPISLFKEMGEPYYSTENYTRVVPYGYWTRLRLKYTITGYQVFDYGSTPSCYIDNLVITGRPYCANPSEWSIVSQTYGGRVIWDKVDAAMSYDINYQVVGDDEWNTVEGVVGYEYDADHLFFDLTGLQANTTYRVNMKSECSNEWPTNYATFTTSDYGSFNMLEYTFEGEGGMPADFSVTGAGAGNISVSTEQSFGADPHSLKYSFVSGEPVPYPGTTTCVEIGNSLNTNDFTDFLVYFDMYCTDVANTYENVALSYKAFGSDGWEENWRSAATWSFSYDSKGWVERYGTFSLPNELQGSASKLRFRLVFTDHGSGESTYIDNIRIFPKGSCQNVNTSSQFYYGATTSTTATFRWTDPNYDATVTPVAHSEGFTVRYRNLTIPTNTNTGWIEENVWVTDPTEQYSITLNNLEPSSYHVLDIRTLCPDGGYTAWSAPHQQFVTECQPYVVKDMEPFVEDFNDIDLACWTYNTRWGRIYDGHDGSNWSLRSNQLDVSSWNDYIDTPEIELNGNYVYKGGSYLVLRFWTKCSGENGEGNKVKVIVDDQETEIFELPVTGCDQWQQIHLSLSRWLPNNNESSNTIRVRFDHESSATAEWFIDDVVITSWDEANYGTRIFDDAVSNDRDWTNDDNWYPNGAPTYSPSMNVTLMSTAWVPDNCSPTVGTMRFGTQGGYLDVQPGGNLTVAEVDIPENKVYVEAGGTLNIGTAHFGFDKVFTNAEGTYNITNLIVDDHWLNFNNGNAPLGTATVTAPGKIVVTNTLNATTVNSSGMFEVYPDAAVTISTLNAAEGSPLNVLIEGTANITTLNSNGENSVVVSDGGVLNANTITSTILPDNTTSLNIEDGGQVKCSSDFVATLKKNITGYDDQNVNDNRGYCLFATPLDGSANNIVVPRVGEEYRFDEVDLYWFNGMAPDGLEWINAKAGLDYIHGLVGLVATKGYLYARANTGEVSVKADNYNKFPSTDQDIVVENLSSSTTTPLGNFNLIGNPYTCNAYLKQGDNYIPFYRMNDSGDAIVGVAAGTPIKPCEGVFMCFTDPSSSVTFTTIEPASPGQTQSGPAVLIPMHQLLANQDASVAAQTIALAFAKGWNWWAPTVQITAAQLRAALNSNLQHLMTKTGEVATDAVLEPGQMYRIQTNEAVDGIMLTGVPTAASISIGEGSSWIGYTGGTTTDISATLASYGITPNIGDKIVSQDQGFAIFNGTSWEGTLTTLESGKGYVYIR